MSQFGRTFLTTNPRRKTKNLVLQPFLQLKLPAYLVVLTFVFAAAFCWHSYVTYDRLFEITLQNTDAPEYFERLLQAQTRNFMVIAGVISLGYLMVMVGVAVAYTHRLIGPTIAFRRQIESLKNGDYSARVNLRPGDAFCEVADDLNELAEALATAEKPPGPGPGIG